MSSAISTAASALRNHQTFMNVVANNIANMNTIGFKSSSVLFQDMLSRTLRRGAFPTDVRGGLNPSQVGLGMRLGAIVNNMNQGVLQSTGRGQDLAITGSGFFIYQGPQQPVYSRDGALTMDSEGNLVNQSTGYRIQGWVADDDGNIDTAQALEDMVIPIGAPMEAVATSQITMAGNINAGAELGDEVATTIQFYDSLGGLHTLDLTFVKNDDNTWNVTLNTDEADVSLGAPTPATLVFNERGVLITPANGEMTFNIGMANGAADLDVTMNLGNVSQLVSGDSRLYPTSQDGRAAGEMIEFVISDEGNIIGVFSNGLLRNLGQLGIAEFVNPGGLEKVGQNGWVISGNSGDPQVVTAGERSQIAAGFLEMSNVDLTLEFSEMIRAQRGFQANSRVVTSSDEMIKELVNMVR